MWKDNIKTFPIVSNQAVSQTKVQKKSHSSKRSLTRLVASQCLYQFEFYNRQTDIDILSKQLIGNYFFNEDTKIQSCEEKIDQQFLESLLSGTLLTLDKIDAEISSFLKGEWKIDNLPEMTLPILRLGVFEIKFMKDIPTKVIISEYVDLAASFYDAKQITFVNSILQNIANQNRFIA